jgi:hypothetical protein
VYCLPNHDLTETRPLDTLRRMVLYICRGGAGDERERALSPELRWPRPKSTDTLAASDQPMSPDSGRAVDGIQIRQASVADLDAIVKLARTSLGWNADNDALFFRWKHFENPFGESPMWTASSNDRIVGFRTFLRWEFQGPDGRSLRAVRAVDTATDPDFQGRGIFRRLTLHGIEELSHEGVRAVFNTPNSKSLPGYLKMGWHVVGRPHVVVKPRSITSLGRLAGARTSAARQPIEVAAGVAPGDAFQDEVSVATLLSRLSPRTGLATVYSRDYLSWRYGFAPLGYRVVLSSDSPADGLAVFRLRRRGSAVEATVCEVLIPDGRSGVEQRLMKRIASIREADYLLRIDRRPWAHRFIRLPKVGPVLTFRSLDGSPVPTMDGFSLTMGDLELF